MKTIFIFCDGGFGNRMGSLISGLSLSKKIGFLPKIIWPKNNWCGAAFGKLFDTQMEVCGDGIRQSYTSHRDSIFITHEHQIESVPRLWAHSNSELDINAIGNCGRDIFYSNNQIDNSVSNHTILEILSGLKINSQILETVYNYITAYNITKDVVGLTVRRTDASVGISNENIKDLIQAKPETRYFVESDDSATEVDLAKLPNVITFSKKHYVEKLDPNKGWNDEITDSEGRRFPFNVNRPEVSVIEAFAGLLILSRTNIVSVGGGSFLKIAQLYSQIKNL